MKENLKIDQHTNFQNETSNNCLDIAKIYFFGGGHFEIKMAAIITIRYLMFYILLEGHLKKVPFTTFEDYKCLINGDIAKNSFWMVAILKSRWRPQLKSERVFPALK